MLRFFFNKATYFLLNDPPSTLLSRYLSNSASFFTASGDTLGAFGKQINITLMLSRLPWEEKSVRKYFGFLSILESTEHLYSYSNYNYTCFSEHSFLRRKKYIFVEKASPPTHTSPDTNTIYIVHSITNTLKNRRETRQVKFQCNNHFKKFYKKHS